MRWLLISALLLTGCANQPDYVVPSRHVALNREFKLSNGETVGIRGTRLVLSFERVEDSRCAANVTCIWAGSAQVTLRVLDTKPFKARQPDDVGRVMDDSLQLDTNDRLPRRAAARGYSFDLLRVEPAPPVDDPAKYVATLRVTRP